MHIYLDILVRIPPLYRRHFRVFWSACEAKYDTQHVRVCAYVLELFLY